MLTREAILAAQDVVSETVDVPEWSGSVRVRVMTGAARDSLSASMRDAAGQVVVSNYRARLLVRCLVDEAGAPLFSEGEIDALNGKSTLVLDRLFAVADRINATSAGAVDAAEKN